MIVTLTLMKLTGLIKAQAMSLNTQMFLKVMTQGKVRMARTKSKAPTILRK
jgi:hypothetical protein